MKAILDEAQPVAVLVQQEVVQWGETCVTIELCEEFTVVSSHNDNPLGGGNIKITTSSTPSARYGGPNNPCYVIFTSGSTGKPKGVVLEHSNVIHFMDAVVPASLKIEEDQPFPSAQMLQTTLGSKGTPEEGQPFPSAQMLQTTLGNKGTPPVRIRALHGLLRLWALGA